MAELARRNWLNLRDELMLRLGRPGVTAFEARAQEFLTAAHFEIGTMFHQYELNKVDTSLVLSTSDRELALPTDCWGIFSFRIGHPSTGAWIATLTWEETHSIDKSYSITAAQPKKFTRYGSNLELPAVPDQAYKTVLRYYQEPTPPDFDTPTSPEYGRWWDEIILDYARMLAFDSLGRKDIAEATEKRIQKYFELNPQPLLRDMPLFGIPTADVRSQPHGGAQG